MAIGPSSLSILCQSVETFVRQGIRAAVNDIDVTVGAPAAAAGAPPKMNRINLFFNRFEPAGFGSDAHPGEPWFMRLHCLVTAFGQDDNAQKVTAGEFELRMIGEVIRLFHETPVMAAVDVNGEATRLQALFQPLTMEALNQIWSTQSDTSLRPSVAYEFSLGPIVPSVRRPVPKKVSRLGLHVRPSASGEWEKEEITVRTLPPRPASVDTTRPGWAPRICFVASGQAAEVLHLELDRSDLDTHRVTVWAAGAPGEALAFQWRLWDEEHGWQPAGSPATGTPQTTTIDPEGPVPEPLTPLALPINAAFEGTSTQAMLFAQRIHMDPATGTEKTIKSNPLLITFYRSDLP
ncbi:MAG: DUF4255 domain-containing protein [Desulfobacter sp.]|nr:MAG: DUF4255 domain-containing protein [Desulfobacter sp.]